jgi:hypothetical protein
MYERLQPHYALNRLVTGLFFLDKVMKKSKTGLFRLVLSRDGF